VTLWERIESANGVVGAGVWNQQIMNDAGTDGDSVGGDGIYSATIAARADNTLVQFYVTASNGAQSMDCPRTPRGVAAVNGSVIWEMDRPAMYFVENTAPSAAAGVTTQRIILSQFHRNAMNPATGFGTTWDWGHPRMSNHAWNATIIINETDVMYNGEVRRGGSPWTRNNGNTLERARWKPPTDDVYRNQPRWGIDSDGTITNTTARFHNRTARYMIYLLGQAVPSAEFVLMIINQDAPSLRDATELTDADFLERAYGEGGELYEIDDAWYMYDDTDGQHGSRLSADGVTGRWHLTDWTQPAAGPTPGESDPIFFHGNWPLRFPEERYDYSAFASLNSVSSAALLGCMSDATTDVVTKPGHGVSTGESIILTGRLPATGVAGGLGVGTTFWPIVTGPDTFKLASTAVNAFAGISLDITPINTGTVAIPVLVNASTLLFSFTINESYPIAGTAEAASDTFTSTGHGLSSGQAAVFTTGTPAAGTGFNAGVTYFAIVLDADRFKLATTAANAATATAVDLLVDLTSFVMTSNTGAGGPRVRAWREQMQRMVDTDRAAMYCAVRGYIADWDNFTRDRGKNGYLFRRPADGKFEFHHWDSDLAFRTTDYTAGILGTAGGRGWENFTTRPWFRQRMNYYMADLLTRYTRNSPRMAAFVKSLNYQAFSSDLNAPWKTAVYSYDGWWINRELTAFNFVTAANMNRVFGISTPNGQTVSAPVYTLNGEAPSRTATIDVVGHPEAMLAWVPTSLNNGLWTLTGIALQNGANALTVRALASDGAVISSVGHTVTLSANGPPLVRLTSNPSSLRLAVNENLVLDATGSVDPEGTALTYAWTILPAAGATSSNPVPGSLSARFAIPGIYLISVQVTDAAAQSATATAEITVYNTNDFNPFAGGLALGSAWTTTNVEYRDNFSGSAWYSVEDTSGRLLIQVLDDTAKPLNSPGFTHPVITRDLPDTSDFILQTDMTPDTREFGGWQSGLWLVVTEGAATVHYAFSIDDGVKAVVRRAEQPNAWSQLATQPVTGSGATLRIRRAGTTLVFQRESGNQWITVHTQTIPGGTLAANGGVFVSTSQAIGTRVSFDYLLVADPAATDSVLANLRVTEIMYNPAGVGGIEYIEFLNQGASPLDLIGVNVEAGNPVDAFTLPSVSLGAGEYFVVTNVTPAALSAAYPLAPTGRIFQWPGGSLSNGGERVHVRDLNGNTIQNFQYDDDPLTNWPTTPDGSGPALEIIATTLDYNLGASWVAGDEIGGTPGYVVSGDSDGDGVSDAMEALAGTDPNNGGSAFVPRATAGADGVTIRWPAIAGRTYRIQVSDSLTSPSWTTLHTVVSTAAGDLTFLDNTFLTLRRRFYRFEITSP
jgi:hypothetical protein